MKHKPILQTALGTAIALGLPALAAAQDNLDAREATGAKPQPGDSVAIMQQDAFDATFLKVSAACKWMHRSFEAASIGDERVADEVLAIHAALERA